METLDRKISPAFGTVEKIEMIQATEQRLRNRILVYSVNAGTQELIKIEFSFSGPEAPVIVLFNPTLHSWTIENLVKNAIDAMKGRGKLALEILHEGGFVRINVSDTGNGIPKNQFKSVFEPGFTTKKRGWGLGLSLTKRIVEEYHKGSIKVLHSEIGKGTTMQVSFKVNELI